MPPLFEFHLTALDQIVPWGGSDDPNLHWFGLSDGQYWMNVGEAKLFEYDSAVRASGAPQFCDYQVVRLHEDVVEIVPYVLEEVPLDLRRFINVDFDQAWDSYWHAWRDLPESIVSEDEHLDLIEFGTFWQGQRTLDSLYLSPPANIRLWSDAECVHIQWNNRDRKFREQLAWTAMVGTYTLTRDAFVEEVLSFHERFMRAMDERVNEVIAGALPKSIRIDIGELVREQQERVASVNRSKLMRSPRTDWAQAAKAVARLEELRGLT